MSSYSVSTIWVSAINIPQYILNLSRGFYLQKMNLLNLKTHFYFMCMSVLHACMSLCHMCAIDEG